MPTPILDGSLADWSSATRLDSTLTGVSGYALYGQGDVGTFYFAISAPTNTLIGANTTIWIDTDLNTTTGYSVFGAAGAEYNINIDSLGVVRLYTGNAGATEVAVLSSASNGDGSIIEIALPKSLLAGSPDLVRVYADVNNATFLPNSYVGTNFLVDTRPPVTVGSLTIDGTVSEWGADTRLDSAGSGPPGVAVYGDAQAGQFVFAITTDGTKIGPGTTIWLDTDVNRSTGFNIFGASGTGADFNVNITSDGVAKLYTGNAGQTFVADITYRTNVDGTGLELAIPRELLGMTGGAPRAVRAYVDVNNTIFEPTNYASTSYIVAEDAPAASSLQRIAIVYSATSAANFYDKTAYGQLFMSAQNQARQAGLPFDLLSESDLTNVAMLSQYKAIVFPGFQNVQASQLDAIESALTQVSKIYDVGLIAAGNFMTNSETGTAFAGDSYARMKTLLGVTLEQSGPTAGVQVVAGSSSNPILDTYTQGSVVGTYTNTGYQSFVDVTGNGQVLFDQRIQTTGGTSTTVNGVIATTTDARNVHFASDAIIGNSNILGEAIDWVVNGNSVDVSLAMTRGTALFDSRTDMDQSQEISDVVAQTPNIYDSLLPIVQNWHNAYGFVGSFYVNIGANPPDQMTDWSVSKPIYQQLIAMGNTIGSHSWTHPDNSNLLSNAHPDLAGLLALVDPRSPTAVDPSTLTNAQKAILFNSFTFQFEYSKYLLEKQLGIPITGLAVPGAPEKIETALQIMQGFDYITAGYSSQGAGYPGAFGYVDPTHTDTVYLAPNMKFDFTLIGFENLTPAQAAAEWMTEMARITAHATTPIISFPWHDYGPTNWELGDPIRKNYTLEMFTNVIAAAAASGAEFVTATDLASRIKTFGQSDLSITRSGNVITAAVTSTDAGRFAITVEDGAKIASVGNWYAYDDTKVFLPKAGGTFQITLGTVAQDATHLVALPQRADLTSVSGNGKDLNFTFAGVGAAGVVLKTQGTEAVIVTGADSGTLDPARLTIGFGAQGTHSVALTYVAGSAANGTAGNDIILGGAGIDNINASDGNDTVYGGAGADVLLGGRGNDQFRDTGGGDQVDGGEGADTARLAGLRSGYSISTVNGVTTLTDIDASNGSIGTATLRNLETLAFDDQSVTLDTIAIVTVTLNNLDNVYVAPTNDYYIVNGLGGNDSITTGNGNDTINGGLGNDTLAGGGGNDVFLVDASAGTDSFDGGIGYDIVRATAANVTIALTATTFAGIEEVSAGGFAGLRLAGTSTADTINLSGLVLTGVSEIHAGSGNDTVTGSSGADTINGGAGNDVLNGGAGNDVFILDAGAGTDRFDGGADYDIVRANAANVMIAVTATTFVGIEEVSSGGFAGLRLAGSTAADTINLSGLILTGVSDINAGSGNDTVTGSSGADTITGGSGNDVLAGGAGNDIFLIGTSAGTDRFDGGADYDIVQAIAANVTIFVNATTFANVEEVSSGGFAGLLLAGTTAADTMNLSGLILTGVSEINAGSGNDTVTGSSGGDTITGAAGNDVLNGGAGNDIFLIGTRAGTDRFDGGADYDIVQAAAANVTITVNATTFANVEEVSSGGFAGLRLTGTAAADTINLSGLTLNGVSQITGGAGNDTIVGSAENNTILGNAGADNLTGGAGQDSFVFLTSSESQGTAIDTIADFLPGTDVIDLSAIDAIFATALENDAFIFIGSSAFAGAAGTLRYDTTSIAGVTRVLGHVDSNTSVDFEVRLTGTYDLTSADFIL